jgi:hypothetical protein
MSTRIPVAPGVALLIGQHLQAFQTAKERLSLAASVAFASAGVEGDQTLLGVEIDGPVASLIVADAAEPA